MSVTVGEQDAFREAVGHFTTGVSVVTTAHGGVRFGVTASAVSSLSLEPPMLLVCLNRRLATRDALVAARHFAVNILAEDQEGLSRLFASPERSSGLQAIHSLGGGYGSTGAPLAAGALAVIECELDEIYAGGDHDLFMGRVVAIRMGDTRRGPLVYHEGGYTTTRPVSHPGESGAFIDSVRGFDVRLRRLKDRRRR